MSGFDVVQKPFKNQIDRNLRALLRKGAPQPAEAMTIVD
jgi:hypothetical protein